MSESEVGRLLGHGEELSSVNTEADHQNDRAGRTVSFREHQAETMRQAYRQSAGLTGVQKVMRYKGGTVITFLNGKVIAKQR